jgi:outer membrane protein assembly factor BamB
VGWLPDRLPAKADPVWTVDVTSPGLGGVAATADHVLFSDRGLNDTADVWKCVTADAGKEVWSHLTPCKGNLDYGNSPRATPLVHGEFVYLLGAFGHLACLKLKSGDLEWELNLPDEFGVKESPKWGVCSSPLVAGGKLIVNPGGKEASLVALDPKTGKTLWKTPGKAAGYGSLLAGTFGGVSQVVGHDADSLGGWEVETGKRLWAVKPPSPNDFNVPTPIAVGDKLLVATENNRTRLFKFDKGGKIDPTPVATNKSLAPDTHTPVVVGDRVFGVWKRLYCLDLADELKEKWDAADDAFGRYAAVVAADKRALVVSLEGELVLFDTAADEWAELGRLKVFAKEKGLYSHPAFVGKRVYVRGSSTVARFDLAG